MTQSLKISGYLKTVGIYGAATALCLLILMWVMRLGRADMTVPFDYGGDALMVSALVKGMLDNGWYLRNRFVGMPTGLELHDYPMPVNLHYLLMKLIGFWRFDYAEVLNLYFLLTFPMTVLAALFVFRRFTVSYPSSIVGSLLFTFLPYHFMRGEAHLYLASYYPVPLVTMVILWVCSEEPLVGGSADGRPSVWGWTRSKVLSSIAICVLVASANVYYSFFAGFFLLVAGVYTYFHQGFRRHALVSLVLVAFLSLSFVANISPQIRYRYQHEPNPIAAKRSSKEADLYGLRITQQLLPVTGHRIPDVAYFKDTYNRMTPLVNENDMVSLGAIGSCGFLLLLGWLFFPRAWGARANLLSSLAMLNISAVLLATIGGFGSLIALAISSKIRGYNRISVYIAFFSLFAVVVLLDRLTHRWAESRIGRWARYGALGLILAVGILDQTTPRFVPPYEQLKAAYLNDADFVTRIEASVPEHAMIFQLPQVRFPEHSVVHQMTDYSHFRGYLHSKTLRWSYGTMKGREGDAWQQHVAAMPLAEMVGTLVRSGFSGIYIDRFGFVDRAQELEAGLTALLKTESMVAADQRLVFFNLSNAGREVTQMSR